MMRVSGAEAFTILGYCIGATFSVIYAALQPDSRLRNLILLTPPLDFSKQTSGSMAQWLDEKVLDLDKMLDTYDNIPGELIKVWAKLLKPMENYVGSYVTMWKLLDDDASLRGWQAINRWVEDVVPVAGGAFRQLVTDYMRENKLIKGELVINGEQVDLSAIHVNLLNVVAKYDHIVAIDQSTSIMDLVSSEDKELRIIPSTHVGLMASHRAKEKLWPGLVDWLIPRSA
jgi:polyhydroxyalkanoate synthase